MGYPSGPNRAADRAIACPDNAKRHALLSKRPAALVGKPACCVLKAIAWDGYSEATRHDHDRDQDLQEEVRNVAHAVAEAVGEMRAGKLVVPDAKLKEPRPK